MGSPLIGTPPAEINRGAGIPPHGPHPDPHLPVLPFPLFPQRLEHSPGGHPFLPDSLCRVSKVWGVALDFAWGPPAEINRGAGAPPRSPPGPPHQPVPHPPTPGPPPRLERSSVDTPSSLAESLQRFLKVWGGLGSDQELDTPPPHPQVKFPTRIWGLFLSWF